MNFIPLRFLILVLLLVGVAACSAHPRKVDCEAHLQPINAPAPVSQNPKEAP
jgi:hypothetical protein